MTRLYLNGRRIHFVASRIVTGSNDRCARCGASNCGCDDWQWNGSPPDGAA